MSNVCIAFRQRRAPVEALQGVLSELQAVGSDPVCLGPHCKEAAEAMPGGTTRLAQVQADGTDDATTPGLDVVLSEWLNLIPPASTLL